MKIKKYTDINESFGPENLESMTYTAYEKELSKKYDIAGKGIGNHEKLASKLNNAEKSKLDKLWKKMDESIKLINERGSYYNADDKESDKEEMMSAKLSDEEQETMDEVSELIRKMCVSAGLDNVYVGNEGYAFQIQYYLQVEEKLSLLKSLMELFVKIKEDTLKEYDNDFAIYTEEADDTEEDGGESSSFIEVNYFQRTSKPVDYTGMAARDFNGSDDFY